MEKEDTFGSETAISGYWPKAFGWGSDRGEMASPRAFGANGRAKHETRAHSPPGVLKF